MPVHRAHLNDRAQGEVRCILHCYALKVRHQRCEPLGVGEQVEHLFSGAVNLE